MTLPFFTSPVKWLKNNITMKSSKYSLYSLRVLQGNTPLRILLKPPLQVNNCTPSLYDWLYTQKNNLPKKICSNAQDPAMLDE